MEAHLIVGFFMVKKNTVQLKVNSATTYNYWSSVSITSEINALSRTFQLDITPKVYAQSEIPKFTSGDEIQLTIGDDFVLTGFIDSTPISYNGTSVTASVVGRSKTEDLVDCNVAPQGYDLSSIKNNSWTKNINGGKSFVSPNISKAVTQFKNIPLKLAVSQLIAPYGIKLVCESNKAAVNSNVHSTVKNSETVFKAIQNLTKSSGLYFMDDEYGNLVIADTDDPKSSGATLELGTNILTASARKDYTQRFSHYWYDNDQKGNNKKFGDDLQQISKCQDDEIKRFRFYRYKEQTMNGGISNGPEQEAKYRKAQSQKITYTVVGWRTGKDGLEGDLWKVNTLVKIKDDIVLGSGVGSNSSTKEMLITKVTFTLDNNGMITTLECVPPVGFRQTDEPAQEKSKVTKKNGSWSSKSEVKLVGQDGKYH
jgi:prophage tail gpP-like protein